MRILGNIIWFLFGGVFAAILWAIIGVICFITIIGIPFGKQCFKMAKLQLAPFGKDIKTTNDNTLGFLGNIIWIIFIGWELALANIYWLGISFSELTKCFDFYNYNNRYSICEAKYEACKIIFYAFWERSNLYEK